MSAPLETTAEHQPYDLKLAIGAGNLVHLRRHAQCLEGRFTSRWASFIALRHHADQHTPVPSVDPARATNGDTAPKSRRSRGGKPRWCGSSPSYIFPAG